MRRKKFSIALAAGAILCIGAVYALGGTAGDPLISLSYLTDSYLPTLMEQVEGQIQQSSAAPQAEQEQASAPEELRCEQGDTLLLSQGDSFLMTRGEALCTTTRGELIDVTQGAPSSAIVRGHRYLVGEGGSVRITSESAPGVFFPEGNIRVFSTQESPFEDLNPSSWYFSAVRWAWGQGLVNGVSDTYFSPDVLLTRGMLVTLLYRMEGQPEGYDSGTAFSDVSPGQWYAQAVQWAAERGIVQGVGGTLFAPDAPLSREQVGVMLYRLAGEPAFPDSGLSFPDQRDVSSWAREGMRWAAATSLLKGQEDGTLRPQSSATRAQVCTILQRFASQ